MPATLAPAPLSQGVAMRAQALAQYLSQVRSPTVTPGPAASIVAKLRSEPWILSQLTQGAAAVDAELASPPELVAHGCALLAKCHSDMGSLKASPDLDRTTLYTYQAELMLDVAVGTALLREMQPAVEKAVAAGDLTEARGFTNLGHQLRNGVASAQQALSEAGRRDAEKLADEMTEQPREQAPTTGALDQVAWKIAEDYERGKHETLRRIQAITQVRLPSRTELLVATLVCSFLLWVGIAKLPRVLDKPPQLIKVGDFSGTSVQEVVARPPSLYVTLDSSHWDSADPAARESILAELVSVPLVDDDYRGALIKTSAGLPLAVWTRKSGIRVLENLEPAASSEAAPKATIFVP